jgi:hypothetical protein
MDDFFQSTNDKIDTDPADLCPAFTAMLSINLAKLLAAKYEKPWTAGQETELQEKMSALIAIGKERRIKTFQVILTRPDGTKASREINLAKIARTRRLQ